MQGGSFLATNDHAQDHRQIGSVINAQVTVWGTTAGTNLLRGISAASDVLLTANSGGTVSQTFNKGTANNFTLGSASSTGGTFNNPVIGTMNALGGTANNLTLGTPLLNVWNGWVQANETWTMLGTIGILGTLQVPATANQKYDKGDRINFVQGGTTMYAAVTSIPSGTTLIITGGTSYLFGTTAITSPQYSKMVNPNGYPPAFGWTPTYPVSSGGMTFNGTALNMAMFSFIGGQIFYELEAIGTTSGTTDNNIIFSIPVALGTAYGVSAYLPQAAVSTNDGTSQKLGILVSNNGTSIGVRKYDVSNWGLGAGRYIDVSGWYKY